MFGLFRKKEKPVGGEISYFGLTDWWLYEFTDVERSLIRETYQPMGSSGYGLDQGKIGFTTQNVLGFISTLAGWFNKEETRHIAYKFLLKADEYFDTDMPVMSRHFAMQARCQAFYRWREHDDIALQEAINSCERGIALSYEAANEFRKAWGDVPSHHCFTQLAIIEEKRGDFDRAIALCRLAACDGWAGDWDKRITRLERKKAKQK